MRHAIGTQHVTGGQIGLAAVLLAGVLAIAYGYGHPNKMALYAGLLLVVGGVISGVIRIVVGSGGGEGRF